MSQIMEKTLASLPKLLSRGLTGNKSSQVSCPTAPSLEVQNFMKCVHRAKSKTQESLIITSELSIIQQKLKEPENASSSSFLRSSFSKVLFCHLLGYDVSFAAITAIKLANQGKGYDKRLGYLVSSLLLNPEHCMAVLMMSTFQRDLVSSDITDNMLALTMAAKLVDTDTTRCILPAVMSKLAHSSDLVKEKAIHCLRAFYITAPSDVMPSLSLNHLLTSRDPGVLTATVNLYLLLCEKTPSEYVGLAQSFLHILHQINSRGFGSNYFYHMVPLPWLQISIIKILGFLGGCDASVSALIEPKLETLIEKTKVSEPVSLAVLVESVHTATRIKASDQLLSLCSSCVGKLLESKAGPDMRYHGLGLLAALVKVKPLLASQHQLAVIASLQDPDQAIQQRTIQILHAMANRVNVKAICSKIFEQISETNDRLFVDEMFSMIAELSLKFSHDMVWYIQTVFQILQHPKNISKGNNLQNIAISKIDNFCMNLPTEDPRVLEEFTAALFDILDNADHNTNRHVVTISLNSLVMFSQNSKTTCDQVLPFMERVLFDRSNAKLLPFNILRTSNNLSENMKNNDDSGLETICIACVECLCELVINKALNVDVVKTWLQKFDSVTPKGGIATCLRLSELKEILSLQNCVSDISSNFDPTAIDLSLSFLDALVVKDLLSGGKPFISRQTIAKHSESHPEDDYNLPTSDLEQSLSVSSDNFFATSNESSLQNSFLVAKGKWREDDDEELDTISHNSLMSSSLFMTDSDLKTSKLADELFAGLSADEARSETFVSKPSPRKSIWDDDSENEEVLVPEPSTKVKMTVAGIDLHPFGKPSRKSKHSYNNTREAFNDSKIDHSALFPNSSLSSAKMYDTTWSESSLHNSVYSDLYTDSEKFVRDQDKSNLSTSTVDDLTDSEPENI